jgi:hypothetical protein
MQLEPEALGIDPMCHAVLAQIHATRLLVDAFAGAMPTLRTCRPAGPRLFVSMSATG